MGIQSADNKQMRIVGDLMSKEEMAQAEYLCYMIQKQNESSYKVYEELLESQVPRELARSVLPVATYSHMFATVNLNNLFKFLAERLHPHAQYEIRVFAEALLEIIEPIVPEAVKAFKTHTLKLPPEKPMEKIVFEKMVTQLAKDGQTIANELDGKTAHNLHMAIGFSGEIAELMDATTRENKVEELGDAEFYLEGLRQGVEVTRDEILATDYGDLEELPTLVSLAGEILDWGKRAAIYRKPKPVANLMIFMALAETQLSNYYRLSGITREEALDSNIEKLGKRYKSGSYSDEQAEARADKE